MVVGEWFEVVVVVVVSGKGTYLRGVVFCQYSMDDE